MWSPFKFSVESWQLSRHYNKDYDLSDGEGQPSPIAHTWSLRALLRSCRDPAEIGAAAVTGQWPSACCAEGSLSQTRRYQKKAAQNMGKLIKRARDSGWKTETVHAGAKMCVAVQTEQERPKVRRRCRLNTSG